MVIGGNTGYERKDNVAEGRGSREVRGGERKGEGSRERRDGGGGKE